MGHFKLALIFTKLCQMPHIDVHVKNRHKIDTNQGGFLVHDADPRSPCPPPKVSPGNRPSPLARRYSSDLGRPTTGPHPLVSQVTELEAMHVALQSATLPNTWRKPTCSPREWVQAEAYRTRGRGSWWWPSPWLFLSFCKEQQSFY